MTDKVCNLKPNGVVILGIILMANDFIAVQYRIFVFFDSWFWFVSYGSKNSVMLEIHFLECINIIH